MERRMQQSFNSRRFLHKLGKKQHDSSLYLELGVALQGGCSQVLRHI